MCQDDGNDRYVDDNDNRDDDNVNMNEERAANGSSARNIHPNRKKETHIILFARAKEPKQVLKFMI